MVAPRRPPTIRVSADSASVNQRLVAERPNDPVRPGDQAGGDLTDVKPASKLGRPDFAMAIVAALVILVIVLFVLVR